jgi:YVTN family beta-propeller protein
MTLDRDLVARALPGYEIGEEIGRGGWGVVLEAVHRQLGRQVAIKQLPRAFAADGDVRRRFATEARLLATLDHPHIVPIYDYVEDNGLCLLVMELLTAGTLWSRMTTTGVTAESACGIVVAASSALDHAHRRGILHRDIKPDNLLFTASGTMKVSDFGIAKVVGGAASMATRTGEVLGTPAYMAPEQALGRDLTPATDVYALGTVLYELLAGRLPYVDDGNAIGLLYRHVHEPPVPLGDVAPTVPDELVAATMRALAIDPAERYQQAADFGVAIADAANATLGSQWLRRGGEVVMAGGEIGARLSGSSRFVDGAPAPHTPPSRPVARTAPSHGVSDSGSPASPPQADTEARASVQPFAMPADPHVPQPPEVERTEPPLPAPEPAAFDAPAVRALRPPAPPTIIDAAVTDPAAVPSARLADPAAASPGGADPAAASPAVVVDLVTAAAAGPGPELSALSPAELVPLDELVIAAGAPLPPPAWPGRVLPDPVLPRPVLPDGALRGPALPDPALPDPVEPASHPAVATPSAAVAAAAGSAKPPRPRRRLILVVVAGLVVAAAVAAGVIVATRSGGNSSRPATVAAKITTAPDPNHLVFAFDAVFVTEPASKAIGRIEPSDGSVAAFTTLPATPHAIAATSDALWVTTADSTALLRIDPHSATTTAVSVGGGVNEIAAGADALWLTIGTAGTVVRIDPSTSSVAATVPVGPSPDSVVGDADGVWVANRTATGTVVRIDPRTNKVVATIAVGNTPDQLALGAGAVWAAVRGDGTVVRIDPATNAVAATIPVGGAPAGVFVGAGAVWVTDSDGNVVERIDPKTNKVTDRLAVPGNPEQAAIGAGSVWVASAADDTVTRIDPGH